MISPLTIASFLPLGAMNVSSRMSLLEDVAYQAVGVITVIASLGIIAILLTLLGKLLQKPPPRTVPASEAAKKPNPETVGAAEEDVSPEVRAVIAAAVYAVMGSGYRVLEIREAHNETRQLWSIEGRRQIFQSHKIR